MTNSRYRWVIVAAGGLLGCVAIGGMFSLPVFLQPIARDTGWSVTGISSAMTIGFLAMAFTSMIWGTLVRPVRAAAGGADRIGRAGGKPGAGEPCDLADRVPAHLRPAGRRRRRRDLCADDGDVTGWFDTHRSLAVSLVSAGMGMAPMTMSPLAAWLVSNHDWRTSMQIVALVVAAIMIPVSLLVRRAPALESGPSAPSGDPAPAGCRWRSATLAAIYRSARDEFLLLATHSGPIIHTVSYAITCGIPMLAAVTIYRWKALQGWGGALGSACWVTSLAPRSS